MRSLNEHSVLNLKSLDAHKMPANVDYPTKTALTRSAIDVSGISSAQGSRHASRDETSRTSSFAFDTPFNASRHQHIQKYHQISGFTTSASGATSASQSGLISALINGNSNFQEQVSGMTTLVPPRLKRLPPSLSTLRTLNVSNSLFRNLYWLLVQKARLPHSSGLESLQLVPDTETRLLS